MIIFGAAYVMLCSGRDLNRLGLPSVYMGKCEMLPAAWRQCQ